MLSVNFTPRITLGKWLWPSRRRRYPWGLFGFSSGIDPESEAVMRLSQGRFDGLGTVASGENETQVFVALGKWHDFLAHGNGDRHIVDAGDPPRGLESPHGLEHAGLRDGNHHDPGSLIFTRHGLDGQSQDVAQNQLLEADPSSEPECPGTQPANGARPHFDDPRTLVIEPQFGMNGTVLQPQGRDSLDRGIHDPALRRFGQPRRGHVNGLLEEWSFQRIRFIEEGEDLKSAPVEKPLQRYLPARNISFNEDMLGGVPQGDDVGLL